MSNENDNAPQDGWSKPETIVAAASGILLPLVVALVGGIYTFFQNDNNEQTLKEQRLQARVDSRTQQVSALLDHLASDKPRERLLGIAVIGQLYKDGTIPAEFYSALTTIASTDESRMVSAAATKVVSNANDTTTVSSDGTVEESKLPAARVYIRIPEEGLRQVAETVKASLEREGIAVPVIQVKEKGPSESQLEYFKGSNGEDVTKILKILTDDGLVVTPVDLSRRNSAGIRPRHYELWITGNASESASK
jgi:hypothetical protein